MRRERHLWFALALALLAAACAGRADKADDKDRGGFYGGVSGGVTRLP